MTTILRGFVLSLREHAECDEIVQTYTELGKVVFLALGTRKMTSKNRVALQLYNHVEMEVFLARQPAKMSKLKKVTIISQFDYEDPRQIDFFQTISKPLWQIDEPGFYTHLKNVYEMFKHNKTLLLKTWFLMRMLDYLGYQQNFQACAECASKKDIATFNLNQGGLLCLQHLHKLKVYGVEVLREFILLHTLPAEEYLLRGDEKSTPLILKHLENFYQTFLGDI